MRSTGILIFIIIAISFFSCKTEEIILHGDVAGSVTDADSNDPIGAAIVELNDTGDTTSTTSEGTYVLRNLNPGEYEIQASKHKFIAGKQTVKVVPGITNPVNFSLNSVPVPGYSSTCLDFGLDSTTLSFTISNLGKGSFSYLITKNQNWITVSPSSGEVTNETDNIRLTIDKTGLSENVYNEIIEVTITGPGVLIKDTIHLNLNGVADRECNYYKVVKIGSQTWMAENLNVGGTIPINVEPQNNGTIEKWCYDCATYGGLYTWPEMMQYNPQDSAVIGTTQGICPVGWHIPTDKEWITLSDYAGGSSVAGAKLKLTGTSLWLPPNDGVTDEYGFAALPGGEAGRGQNPDTNPDNTKIELVGRAAIYMESDLGTPPPPVPIHVVYIHGLLNDSKSFSHQGFMYLYEGGSVRCLKNPVTK